jgi:hypothetical protein
MQAFDNVIYLTFMMAILTGLFHFLFKQDTISIAYIWWLVLGAWAGSAIVYIFK